MSRGLAAGTIAALAIAGVLIALDAHDFAQEPPTDTADAVATVAVLAGIALWVALRWARSTPTVRFIRAAAVGVAIGAAVIGLASVVYDPFAS